MKRGTTALMVALAIMSGAAAAYAQGERLRPGAERARAGVHSLSANFAPDPFEVAVRMRGALHVGAMGLGAGCRGYTAAEPDVIVRFSGAATFLRFFARSDQDITLIVHDPSGRFLCNDDVIPGRNTNPMVDIYQPRAGQYDVWIGTPQPNQEIPARLFLTQQRTQRP